MDGVRLDRALAALTGISRTVSRELIDSGDVTVDGVVASRRLLVRASAQNDPAESELPAGPWCALCVVVTGLKSG